MPMRLIPTPPLAITVPLRAPRAVMGMPFILASGRKIVDALPRFTRCRAVAWRR